MRETDAVSDEGEPLPRGLYCHLTEYPEEGCMPLFEVTANVELSGPTAGLSPEGRARTQGYASKDAKC